MPCLRACVRNASTGRSAIDAVVVAEVVSACISGGVIAVFFATALAVANMVSDAISAICATVLVYASTAEFVDNAEVATVLCFVHMVGGVTIASNVMAPVYVNITGNAMNVRIVTISCARKEVVRLDDSAAYQNCYTICEPSTATVPRPPRSARN